MIQRKAIAGRKFTKGVPTRSIDLGLGGATERAHILPHIFLGLGCFFSVKLQRKESGEEEPVK
jgi:hypothetical protein